MHFGLNEGVKKLVHDALEKFGLKKFYFCHACDSRLVGRAGLCSVDSCQLKGVPLKRSKNSRRTSMFTIRIEPQLNLILQRVLKRLIDLHEKVHNRDDHFVTEYPPLSETSSFPKYKQDIEPFARFQEKQITVVLTLNVVGVRFKKLSRSECWPIYLRMEGLPYEEKNKYENIILAGLLFTSKTPTERLLTEFFARLKNELISLKENGIPVIEKNSSPIRTWVCVPELKNGIIDFGALKTLYNLPRWQSLQGCHLCTFPGRRAGRRVIWFNRFPNISDRRTEESLIIDADMRQNGLRGFTQMMDLFMVNRCMPDALHLLSEGITTTIFKAMFDSRRNASIMAVQKQCIGVLNTALVKTRNYTYSSKFILALSDMSRCTGSEKDALSFLAFPLAAALNMFVEPVGAVAVLAYWILVRVLEKTKEITSADFPGIRDLANSMKFLWYDLDPTLFTLKVHCFIDHALLEDLPFAGSPYNWSSNSFESVHRRLQLRVAQCTTNVEEKLINNFLFHKDIVDLLGKEVQSCENVQLDRLHRKITEGTTYRTERRVASISLKTGWSVPVAYKIEMDEVTEEHKNLLRALMPDECRSLAARVCHDGKIYSSAFYRRRDRDTIQSCVYLETPDGDALYGIVIAFVYDTWYDCCYVLMEELSLEDAFNSLAEALHNSNHLVKTRACSALRKIADNNRFFKRVSGKKFALHDAYEIKSHAVLIQDADFCFVSRI
ncbi:hypothetical protein Q1695_005456 [Nippostrongylus brasiliensis]|nr:hypothetical protein Q1695_005456 [Nippostrongylus brasiliensis]